MKRRLRYLALFADGQEPVDLPPAYTSRRHQFTPAEDGISCATCQLPRANYRHSQNTPGEAA